MSDLQQILAAIAASEAGTKAVISEVGRNVDRLEQTVGAVVGTVQALTSQCEKQEESLADLRQKFVRMETELSETRAEMVSMKSHAPSFSSIVKRKEQVVTGANLQEQEAGAGLNANRVGVRREEQERWTGVVKGVGIEKEEHIRKICDKTRRTIGFNRIGEDDILRMYGEAVPWGGAKTREQARKLAAQEFMACELKISKLDLVQMEIEDIFERKSDHLDTIYVRFKYRSSLSRIFENVKFLTNGRSNLVTYIPREFQDRFRALNEILKPVRAEGEGWRTRVKMGQDDLIISKKTKQKGAVYEDLEFDMSSLPQICLNRPQPQVTDSPPPGRPGHWEEMERRKRRSSGGSSTGVTPQNRAKRNDRVSEGELENSAA